MNSLTNIKVIGLSFRMALQSSCSLSVFIAHISYSLHMFRPTSALLHIIFLRLRTEKRSQMRQDHFKDFFFCQAPRTAAIAS